MRRRIRRVAALAAVALVASGQVKAPRASQFVRGRKRRQQQRRRRSAILLSEPTLPLAFPYFALFFLAPSVLWDRWNGMFFRPVDPEARTRGKKGRLARGSNVLSCCSVTFFWLNIFSLSLFFLHILPGLARLVRARRGVRERPLLDRRGEQEIVERRRERRSSLGRN